MVTPPENVSRTLIFIQLKVYPNSANNDLLDDTGNGDNDDDNGDDDDNNVIGSPVFQPKIVPPKQANGLEFKGSLIYFYHASDLNMPNDSVETLFYRQQRKQPKGALESSSSTTSSAITYSWVSSGSMDASNIVNCIIDQSMLDDDNELLAAVVSIPNICGQNMSEINAELSSSMHLYHHHSVHILYVIMTLCILLALAS